MAPRNILVLGSTGSIGVNTLKVIAKYPKQFCVCGISAYSNVSLLKKQIEEFKPKYVAVKNKFISKLKSEVSVRSVKYFDVDQDLEELVAKDDIEIIVIGMPGSAALKPFLKAVRLGKRVAPANKEALVIAGELLMSEACKYGAEVIPVDSEQSAIFQCLEGRDLSFLKRVHLTASGGALLNVPKSKFNELTVEQILNHPRWKMGKKITVDSATLMNKGFEVIEAMRLFNLDVSKINVVVHPEAIIHSMVEFVDGSVLAQLGITDMRIPIQYALTYPARLETGLPSVDFAKVKQLNFSNPDVKKFPLLEAAFEAARQGGTLPAVLNAVDEDVVEAFLAKKIKFTDINKIVEKVLRQHKIVQNPSLEQVFDADQWAREQAQSIIQR